MPTYIIQSQWTDQGIRNVKESAKRLDLGKRQLKELGGESKHFISRRDHTICWLLSMCPMMRFWPNTYYGLVRKAISERRR